MASLNLLPEDCRIALNEIVSFELNISDAYLSMVSMSSWATEGDVSSNLDDNRTSVSLAMMVCDLIISATATQWLDSWDCGSVIWSCDCKLWVWQKITILSSGFLKPQWLHMNESFIPIYYFRVNVKVNKIHWCWSVKLDFCQVYLYNYWL